jgi:CDP-6-deoxy-D-xylo-4-hexulose-3-dehydrase
MIPVNTAFMPGDSFIPASGQVVGAREKELMHEAVERGWLTAGPMNRQFEDTLCQWIGAKAVRTVNSGSSANLVAFMSLTSPHLGNRAIKPGDEVITVACGFPTTINPIIQAGCVPVFVDINTTLNIDTKNLDAAVTPKTKAVMIAHTLGNPFNMEEIRALCDKHNLWLIEDCCDALGATWQNKYVGTFGDLATLSFFPAHHITMGEGGAVIINNTKLTRAVESTRDWGRDCWCEPGRDNTCKRRFEQQHGELPYGYDHKYVFTHLGYNLKITEMQAACGVAQLEQLDMFIARRRENYGYLRERLVDHEEFWLPTVYPDAHPSWFGFPITLSGEAKFQRRDIEYWLNQHNIGTRLIFAGNVTKQPYMKGREYRVHGSLEHTDYVMENTFWVGVQPALTREMLTYVADTIERFLEER